MRFKSFLPERQSNEPHLNIVMPPSKFDGVRVFKDIAEFEQYTKKLVGAIAAASTRKRGRLATALSNIRHSLADTPESGIVEGDEHLAANEPYLLLFPETPFHLSYFPTRTETRALAKRLSKHLAEKLPLASIAFSINEKSFAKLKRGEKSLPVHANSGYLLSAEGYSKFFKQNDAQYDRRTANRIGEQTIAPNDGINHEVKYEWSGSPDWPQDGLGERIWKGRSERQRKSGMLFPTVKLASGHEIEHRVCLDGIEVAGKGTPERDKRKKMIAVVSARGIHPTSLKYLREERQAVVLNDLSAVGRQVAFGGDIFYLENLENAAAGLGKLLAEKKLKIHLVD